MTSRVTHAVLNGATVRFDTEQLDLGFPFSSVALYLVNGRYVEFSAGSRDWGRAVATDLAIVLDVHYSLQGAQLSIGTGTVTHLNFPDMRDTITMAVWEGASWSVHTQVYWKADSHALIDIFNQFVFVESPMGVQIVPRGADRAVLHRGPALLKEIPEVGLLQVKELVPGLARTLPAWAGTKVRGGELFRESMGSDGQLQHDEFYLLVGPSTVTLIMPGECSDDPAVAGRIADLIIEWQSGAAAP